MFCPNCGKEIQDNQLFCMNCGTKIPNKKNNNNDDNNQEYNYNNTYPKPQEGVLTLTRENQLVSPIFSFPIFVDGTEINKISVGETVNIKLALGQHRIEIKLLGKTIGILNVLIDDSHLSQYYNFKTDINNRVKATTTNIVNNTQNINYSSINHQQPITSYPLKPKKKKGCGYIIGVTVIILVCVFFILTIIGAIDVKTENAPETNTTTISQNSKKSNNVDTNKKVNNKVKQFKEVGFNQKEAEKLSKQFDKMGIEEISDIEPIAGTGIDDLQSFRCKMYDYDTLQVNFTIEDRDLIFLEIAGLPATKTEFYINMFGNLKTKQVGTTTSVTLFDCEVDNDGNTIQNSKRMIAVFDNENKKITACK